MTRLTDLLARTVARVGPRSVPVTVTIAGASIDTRGTWTPEDEILTRDSGELIVRESEIRIPRADLPSLPKDGDPIRVDGNPFYVGRALDRGSVVVIELTKSRLPR